MKNKVDKGLKLYYTPLKLLPYLASRNWGINLINFLVKFMNGNKIKGLHNEERFIPSKNGGPAIRVRIFKPLNTKGKLPLMEYIHGGGYLIGSPEMIPNLEVIKQFIAKRPCVVIVPAYRKAMDAPYPAALNDCYDTILWAKENAESLGIYDDNFMVAGHSAGGGLTAAVTLKARDTKDFKIAFQMPIYPMIDDRQNSDSAKEMTNVPAWNSSSNKKGWETYLKGIKEVPNYAAPARNTDYTNFPPTITFVGDLEPFKDETLVYVALLMKENIPVQFKLYKGAFHGFDQIARNTPIGKDAIAFTYNSYAAYYDKYITKQTK